MVRSSSFILKRRLRERLTDFEKLIEINVTACKSHCEAVNGCLQVQLRDNYWTFFGRRSGGEALDNYINVPSQMLNKCQNI